MSDTVTSEPADLPPPSGDQDGADAAPTPLRDRNWLVWSVVLPLIIVLVAGTVRFYQLGNPERCYFDETYYYYDARDYLQQGTEDSFAVHPPVGKWLIAISLSAFGTDENSPEEQAIVVQDDNCLVDEGEGPNPEVRAREAADAFARRAASAFFGSGAVLVTYFIGLRMFRRQSAALLAGALLAVDGLAVTMSRIAMLDIFLQFFVVLGVLALLVDRERMWAAVPDDLPATGDGDAELDAPPPDLPTPNRGWLWAAGLFFGLAVATKWSALAPIGLAWAWLLASELWWRRRLTGSWTVGLGGAIGRGVLALVVVPVVVYLVSYSGWFANFEDTRKADRCQTEVIQLDTTGPVQSDGRCEGVAAVSQILGGWWEEQGEIFRFHSDLEAEHPYRAPAYTWPLMTRPVAYYYESCPEGGPADGEECVVAPGTVSEVLGLGNPAIWWMALLGYPFLFFFAIARRSWPALTIALFLFGQTVPYAISPRPVFLFYVTPAVPFIVLSLAFLVDKAMDSFTMKWVPATVAFLATAAFVFWSPVFLGLEVPRRLWDAMILWSSWV